MGTADDNAISGNGGSDVIFGGAGRDILTAGNGADLIDGEDGDDTITAGGGNDMVFGGKGADRILAGEGDDIVDGGEGDDVAFGGGGDDTFIANINDGNDRYFGDAGNDSLDMSAIVTNIQANLGTGLNGLGYARTAGNNDVLQGIENIATGSGNDTIVASGAVNEMDGGTGNDVFVFRTASDADGDTILNFEPGDRIDLSGFMSSSVSLVTGTPSTGQIQVTHEQINGEDFTVLHGNTDADSAAEFTLNIKGYHNLSNSNFA